MTQLGHYYGAANAVWGDKQLFLTIFTFWLSNRFFFDSDKNGKVIIISIETWQSDNEGWFFYKDENRNGNLVLTYILG